MAPAPYSALEYRELPPLLAISISPAPESLNELQNDLLLHSSNPFPDLLSMWNVFTKCANYVENGKRLENLSWRLINPEFISKHASDELCISNSSRETSGVSLNEVPSHTVADATGNTVNSTDISAPHSPTPLPLTTSNLSRVTSASDLGARHPQPIRAPHLRQNEGSSSYSMSSDGSSVPLEFNFPGKPKAPPPGVPRSPAVPPLDSATPAGEHGHVISCEKLQTLLHVMTDRTPFEARVSRPEKVSSTPSLPSRYSSSTTLKALSSASSSWTSKQSMARLAQMGGPRDPKLFGKAAVGGNTKPVLSGKLEKAGKSTGKLTGKPPGKPSGKPSGPTVLLSQMKTVTTSAPQIQTSPAKPAAHSDEESSPVEVEHPPLSPDHRTRPPKKQPELLTRAHAQKSQTSLYRPGPRKPRLLKRNSSKNRLNVLSSLMMTAPAPPASLQTGPTEKSSHAGGAASGAAGFAGSPGTGNVGNVGNVARKKKGKTKSMSNLSSLYDGILYEQPTPQFAFLGAMDEKFRDEKPEPEPVDEWETEVAEGGSSDARPVLKRSNTSILHGFTPSNTALQDMKRDLLHSRQKSLTTFLPPPAEKDENSAVPAGPAVPKKPLHSALKQRESPAERKGKSIFFIASPSPGGDSYEESQLEERARTAAATAAATEASKPKKVIIEDSDSDSDSEWSSLSDSGSDSEFLTFGKTEPRIAQRKSVLSSLLQPIAHTPNQKSPLGVSFTADSQREEEKSRDRKGDSKEDSKKHSEQPAIHRDLSGGFSAAAPALIQPTLHPLEPTVSRLSVPSYATNILPTALTTHMFIPDVNAMLRNETGTDAEKDGLSDSLRKSLLLDKKLSRTRSFKGASLFGSLTKGGKNGSEN